MSEQSPELFAEFVSLLTEYQPDLWSFIISLMPGDSEVGDVLQKTNLVLWVKREKFEAGSNFRAWAFAIARLEVLAHIKKQKRRGQVLLDEELLETIACEAPEELGRADLRLAALENCLNKIRTEDRELLIHRYQSASGLEEFSERVGRSVSSLSVTLHRLRIALRKCIQNQIAPGGEPT